MRWLALAIALLGCSFRHGAAASRDAALATPDGPPAWRYRRSITASNTGLSTDLHGFPVPVTLLQQDNLGALGASSTDVRFFAADGTTPLPYDVDSASASGATFWVPIDIPAPPAAPPMFWVELGDTTGAGPAPDPAAVWASYVSVHHLSDLSDASGHGHDGVPDSATATPAPIDGEVGGAQHFDGTSDAVPLTASATGAYDFTTAFSVSVWIRLVSFDVQWECFVCKGDSSWRIHRGDTSNHASFGISPAGGTNTNVDTGPNVNDGQWHLVAIEYDGTTARIYLDDRDVQMTNTGAFATNSYRVVLGRNEEANNPSNRYLAGDLDELRASGMPLGRDWFSTEYRSATDASFLTFGAIETLP